MTWKPSRGLLKAEAVTQILLQDAATVGIHITNPALRWRMVEVISNALDQALSDGAAQPELPGFPDGPDFDEVPHTGNGIVRRGVWTPFDPAAHDMVPGTTTVGPTVELQPDPNNPDGIIAIPQAEAVPTQEATGAPQRRSRGRPKGSGNKKKKARARAARAEAQQASEPQGEQT